MKKIISVLLSVLMIFSLVSVGASAAEKDEFQATVVNDLHYNFTYGNYSGKDYAGTDYKHVPSNGQLWIESILIIKTFFNEIAKNDSKYVFIPGDITDHGNYDEHNAMVTLLSNFEKDTGKKVYVVPGNHDYHSTHDEITPEIFADLYKNFGYSEEETVARDTLSASYVVDLDNDYRLLAIDSCLPGSGNSGINEQRLAWITEQTEQAQKDGKKLISMMHHNLLDHFIFGEMIHPGAFVDSELGLAEIYSQYNVKYTFTGHTHAQDIKAFTGSNGVTIYDVLTSSLNLYPLPYRNVVFGDEVSIKTEYIESVDMTGKSLGLTSKKGIISDNCFNLATKDFQKYALECANYGLNSTINSYLTYSGLKGLLHLNESKDADLCAVLEKILPRLAELAAMPMYKKDAKGGMSLEAYASTLNLEFPVTDDIKNFKDLAIFLYQQYVTGDENFGIASAEYILFNASLSTLLNLLLKDVAAEDYARLLNYLGLYFNLKTLNTFNKYAGDAISRAEGIDVFVSALSSSVILLFTTDEYPSDNDAALPGFEEPAEDTSSLTLFQRIAAFFRNLFDYIRRFFGIGK